MANLVRTTTIDSCTDMEYKKARGPATKSCLTCKRRCVPSVLIVWYTTHPSRHKKCDLKRPKCDRCTKGRYECAYGPSEKVTAARPAEPHPSKPLEFNQLPQSEGSDQSQSTPSSSSSASPDIGSEIATVESIFKAIPSTTPFLLLRLGWFWLTGLSALCYFKPIEQQIVRYREIMVVRLQSSSIFRRIKLISFKVHEAIANGQDWRYQAIFTQWWTNLKKRSILLSNQNSYRFLRFVAPTFLQTVYSDPTLWNPDSHLSTSVSIAHALSSIRCEIANFVIMDTFYSMAYSLPQLVEYDTSIISLQNELESFSWIHGCPTEFQVMLAEINQCREGQPTSTGRGWKEIEADLLMWQAKPIPQEAEWRAGWLSLGWLFGTAPVWGGVIQEYICVCVCVCADWDSEIKALCGAASDDPRVQHSVKQLLKVARVVKKPSRPVASAHFFAQYFIAGVCARTESQRTFIREKLANMSESRNWLVHGNIFVPVLEHLWTGAGAGGNPVRWEDYVRSRKEVLPFRTHESAYCCMGVLNM
ncbi:hypothetical protein RHS01_05935 [Rhizoctonia solani]|uniref:Zn(2)-C6 fungal-type domain-containing protein n=1 Tax=Rhizoctonia solani TaxID=456999 RepID=A0A8H7IC48_9AGAM|nr:hypothetical protein RHS01_05935 [Rhizoctonia solani]